MDIHTVEYSTAVKKKTCINMDDSILNEKANCGGVMHIRIPTNVTKL